MLQSPSSTAQSSSSLADVITGLIPTHESLTAIEVRNVTEAYANGAVDLDTYRTQVGFFKDMMCETCSDRYWQFEVPKADGNGALYLCHSCYWALSNDKDALKQRLRCGEVVEFGPGMLMRELARAMAGRFSSLLYAQGGLMISELYSPMSQTCEHYSPDLYGRLRICGTRTTGSRCPRCSAHMPDPVGVWRELVSRRERETGETAEHENDSEAEAMHRQEVDGND